MENLIDAFTELLDELKKMAKLTPEESDDVDLKFVIKTTEDGGLDVHITNNDLEEKPAKKKAESPSDKAAKQVKEACREARMHFHKQVKNFDKEVFDEACASFRAGELSQLRDDLDCTTNVQTVTDAANKFLNACNAVIMDRVSRLKSQMVSL